MGSEADNADRVSQCIRVDITIAAENLELRAYGALDQQAELSCGFLCVVVFERTVVRRTVVWANHGSIGGEGVAVRKRSSAIVVG